MHEMRYHTNRCPQNGSSCNKVFTTIALAQNPSSRFEVCEIIYCTSEADYDYWRIILNRPFEHSHSISYSFLTRPIDLELAFRFYDLLHASPGLPSRSKRVILYQSLQLSTAIRAAPNDSSSVLLTGTLPTAFLFPTTTSCYLHLWEIQQQNAFSPTSFPTPQSHVSILDLLQAIHTATNHKFIIQPHQRTASP